VEKALQDRTSSHTIGPAIPPSQRDIGGCLQDGHDARNAFDHSMRILYVADLHYSLKQFDWLLANAGSYDIAAIRRRSPGRRRRLRS